MEEQLADGFTKALGRMKFADICVKLGLHNIGGEEWDQEEDWWGVDPAPLLILISGWEKIDVAFE